jgi:hypothetical protein
LKRTALPITVVVCFFIAVTATHLSAQSAPLKQSAYLKASNPGMGDHFGEGGALPGHTGMGVAISRDGNTIAVGAPHESSSARGINGNEKDDSAYNAGAVYVYVRSGGQWTRQAYVKASNAGGGDYFGSYVALSADGNTMAVSAHWESSAATGVNGNQNDDSLPQAGAVYIFTRSGTAWTQQAYLKASNTGRRGTTEEDPGDGDQFGFSLAISGDGNTVAVGANSEDSAAAGAKSDPTDDSFNSAGAVYVFTRSGTRWSQQAYLKADASTNTGLGDQFGFSLSLNGNGNTLAVGVYDESGSGRTINAPIDRMRGGSGAVYVFGRTGTGWTREAYLKTWNADGGDSWGVSVALSDDGNTLATGSLDEDCTCTGVQHAPSNLGLDDQKADLSTGAVAVFVRSGGGWSQQAYLKASNTGQEDWFGVRLALSGDGNTLAASAPNEDSAAQGIDGRQNDDSANEAGAVYVFTRNGASWSQLAYVKGANTEAFDEFGGAVGLSRDGRTMVVGAKGEDGVGGINGNQADNSVDEAGAAYVFSR